MSHEILDYSLIAAILGWVTKQGVEVFRHNKRPNGSPSLEDIRRVAGESVSTIIAQNASQAESLANITQTLLTDIRDLQRQTQASVSELVTIARMKLN